MLELKYEDYNFDHAASDAIDQGVSFCVVITGLRARLIIKAKPLIWLLFDNPEQPIRSRRFTIIRLQVMYLTWTASFWGTRFLATRAGMKESWAEKNGILKVSFLAEEKSGVGIVPKKTMVAGTIPERTKGNSDSDSFK